MSKAEELLERVLEVLSSSAYGDFNLKAEIREYLESEKPEKQGPLSDEEILNLYFSGIVFEKNFFSAFNFGYRMAEKHHGIQGDCDE